MPMFIWLWACVFELSLNDTEEKTVDRVKNMVVNASLYSTVSNFWKISLDDGSSIISKLNTFPFDSWIDWIAPTDCFTSSISTLASILIGSFKSTSILLSSKPRKSPFVRAEPSAFVPPYVEICLPYWWTCNSTKWIFSSELFTTWINAVSLLGDVEAKEFEHAVNSAIDNPMHSQKEIFFIKHPPYFNFQMRGLTPPSLDGISF